MTDTTELATAPSSRSRSGRSGLAAMNVAELKGLAAGLGVTGTTKMRKDDLVAAITARQGAGQKSGQESAQATERGSIRTTGQARPSQDGAERRERAETITLPEPADSPPADTARTGTGTGTAERDTASAAPAAEPARADRATEPTEPTGATGTTGTTGTAEHSAAQNGGVARADTSSRTPQRSDTSGANGTTSTNGQQSRYQQGRTASAPARSTTPPSGTNQASGSDQPERRTTQPPSQGASQAATHTAQPSNQGAQTVQSAQQGTDEDGTGGRRRSRQRSRDRKRGRPTTGTDYEPELQINDDDVLVAVAGILDVLDNYAFVRTSGYLPGPNDVYVPLGLVKKYALRKGDAVSGAVKAPRDGEQPQTGAGTRQKFNALVRLDSINGAAAEGAKPRPEFGKLTPLYPQERLRLETETTQLTTRVIDLLAPIGKGQRGLVVAPANTGKTAVLQAIANAITTNNPECHLMVVLVDERPEDVTEMQRAVKGEVIASTFDRPAEDHTTAAELSIERAKRLVELGHDVVVLLDSVTKLARAYNLAVPASGRTLPGGVDSGALHPTKRFFGAARNVENGGSLTIIATALVDTGSPTDEVILEEFRGTGTMELRLSGELAARRIFPAVDVFGSGTRRDELLMSPEELTIVWKLRTVLGALDPDKALELLLDRLRRTRTNIEFLRQVQSSSSTRLDDAS